MDDTVAAPLTFGQLWTWRDFESMPQDGRKDMNMVRTWPVPEGCSQARVRAALDELVDRHEVLRTVYRRDDGEPVQLVHRASPAPVRVLALSDDVAPADVDAAVQSALVHEASAAFDLTSEYSWRPMIVTWRGAPRTVAVVINHIASDNWSNGLLEAELATLLAGGGLGVPRAPRALAERQRSAEWQPRSEAARRYWSELSAALGGTADMPGYRYSPADAMKAHLVSDAAGQAVHRLSTRLRVSTSSVVLAAYALAVSTALETPRVLTNVMCSNRFHPGTEDMIGTMNQWVPLLVEPRPGEAFADLVARTHWTALRAYRHGCYHPDAFIRDWHLDPRNPEASWPGFFFNFFSEKVAASASVAPGAASRFDWLPATVRTGPSFYLVGQQGRELTLLSRVMREGFAPDRLGQVMRLMERTLVSAAQ